MATVAESASTIFDTRTGQFYIIVPDGLSYRRWEFTSGFATPTLAREAMPAEGLRYDAMWGDDLSGEDY